MKKYLIIICSMIFLVGMVSFAEAQDQKTEPVAVKFSDASKPGLLKVYVLRGTITVKGYSGNEVIWESSTRERAVKKEEEEKQKSGLKRITVNSASVVVEEKDNVMEMGVESIHRTVDLTIQVPRNTSLKLSSTMNGEISVENVNGEIEAQNTNGPIKLINISGTAVANTTNGDVRVVFTRVDPGKPMAFSTFNGDVDVTLPAATKASLKLKTLRGEVYSDFDLKLEQRTKKQEKDSRREHGGRYHLTFESAMFGDMNGGGPEFSFSTWNGDIFIRKSK